LRFHNDPLLNQVALAWRRFLPYPFTQTSANTLTAIQALVHGQADIIAVRRPMTCGEQAQFRQFRRLPLLSVPIGLTAIGLFVNRLSSLQSLSLSQLEALFSASRSCHYPPPESIPHSRQLYGLSLAIGSHTHFTRLALCGGALKPQVTLLSSDTKVVETVAREPGTLGYANSSLGGFEGVRLLALRRKAGDPPIHPTSPNLLMGNYPLTHYLYLHLAGNGTNTLAFARYVLSDQGQSQLARYGFTPLPRPLRQRLLLTLEDH